MASGDADGGRACRARRAHSGFARVGRAIAASVCLAGGTLFFVVSDASVAGAAAYPPGPERTIASGATSGTIAEDVNGDILVVDPIGDRVFRMAPSGRQTTLPFTGLNLPLGVTVDAGGAVYVANARDGRVFKLAPDGTQTTLEFTFTASDFPYSIAVDGAGNVYVTSAASGDVRQLTPAGVETTVLTGVSPYGLGVDAAGNLYAPGAGSNPRVKRRTPAGVETETRVVYDDPPGFGSPFVTGMAVDSAGNVFLADQAHAQVIQLAPSGEQTTVPVGGLDQVAAGMRMAVRSSGNLLILNSGEVVELAAPFSNQRTVAAGWGAAPIDVATDATNNLYVVDGSSKIFSVAPDGARRVLDSHRQTRLARAVAVDGAGDLYVASDGLDPFGSEPSRVDKVSTTGSWTPVSDLYPHGLTGLDFDGDGNVFVSQWDEGITWATEVIKTAPDGTRTTLPFAGLVAATDVAVDDAGNVYVADLGRVTVLDTGGVQTDLPLVGQYTQGLAFDSAGTLFITDRAVDRVLQYDPSTGTVTEFPVAGPSQVSGIAVDGDANVYVVSTGNGAVFKFSGGTQSSLDPLRDPQGLAHDGAGNVYIAYADANKVMKLTPAGLLSDVGVTGLNAPHGVAIDSLGSVYVGDTGDNDVVKRTSAGVQSVVATAGLSGPTDVAIDADDNLYIADTGNNAVTRVTPGGVQSTLAFTGLLNPTGVSVDSAGTVSVADKGNLRIVTLSAVGVESAVDHITPPTDVVGLGGGRQIMTRIGYSAQNRVVDERWERHNPRPVGFGGVLAPAAVDVDGAGNIIVADPGSRQVVMLLPSAPTRQVLGPSVTVGVAAKANGNLIISAAESGAVIELQSDGTLTEVDFGDLDTPAGVAVAPDGTIFVVDNRWVGDRVLQRAPDGTVSDVGFTGLTFPTTIARDAAGNLYVIDVDTPNALQERVIMMTPAAAQTVLLAGLEGGAGVAVDAAGNLYVTVQETGNAAGGRVIKRAPDGTVSDFGSGWVRPIPIAVDNDGTVLVGNFDNINAGAESGVFAVAPDGTKTRLGFDPFTGDPYDGTAQPNAIAITPGGDVVMYGRTNSQIGLLRELPAAPTVETITGGSGPESGGTSVTLGGTNLADVTAVTFGGTPAASFMCATDGSCSATSPPGTGIVNVAVTNDGGTSEAPSAFTYVPPPVITGVTPAVGPVAGGTVVTIAGTGLAPATAVAFGATPAASFDCLPAQPCTATSPPGVVGPVDITITTLGGVSAVVPAGVFTYVQTAITGTPSPGVPVGGVVSDAATVTGASPTGAVTFRLFSDETCTTRVFTSTKALTLGQATSDDFTTTAAGTYRWVALYAGDANNAPVSTACDSPTAEVVVSQAVAGLTATASPAVEMGSPVHDDATVTGFNPSGPVTFRLFGPDDATCREPAGVHFRSERGQRRGQLG